MKYSLTLQPIDPWIHWLLFGSLLASDQVSFRRDKVTHHWVHRDQNRLNYKVLQSISKKMYHQEGFGLVDIQIWLWDGKENLLNRDAQRMKRPEDCSFLHINVITEFTMIRLPDAFACSKSQCSLWCNEEEAVESIRTILDEDEISVGSLGVLYGHCSY